MASAVGKLISIFLIDGIPDGRQVGEISNWTGRALKIPRKLLKESSSREEMTKTSVYFLFGQSENDPEKNAVYIGETEEVFSRLKQHLNKEFWSECVLFTSKDDNLNKAHVKYLESKIYDIALKLNRYEVINSSVPSCPTISESEQSVMSEYLSNLKILINTMGYKFLESINENKLEDREIYYIKSARGANGKAILTNEGVVVLKESEIAIEVVPSMSKTLIKMRQKIIDSNVIDKKNGRMILNQDYLFKSPSAAAAFVMGRNTNGLESWKDKKGKTIRDNEEG